MIELTETELERIIYLKASGYLDQVILEDINEKRKENEKTKVEDEDFYVFCVLDQEED